MFISVEPLSFLHGRTYSLFRKQILEMQVKRNIEALSCNHCCSGKAIRIIYSECVSVALVIQQANRMRLVIQRDSKRWT